MRCIKINDNTIDHEQKKVCIFPGYCTLTSVRHSYTLHVMFLLYRTYLKKIWLGADDKQTEGVWVWQDGTNVTWSNWKDSKEIMLFGNYFIC